MGGVVYLSYANNPEDTRLVHLRAERDAVKQAFRPLMLDHKVAFDSEDNTELDNVLERLRDRSYAEQLMIFGFSGHAGGQRLIFNDEEARGQGLANLMRKGNCPHLKVVFLNGCVTHEHLKFFEDNDVPIIITTNAPVGDERAMKFSATFFSRLTQGDTIYEAYLHAFGEITTQEQVKERVRCYRKPGFDDYPENVPVWELAYREERFKNWTLEHGMEDPPEWSTLQGISDATTRLLYFGDKHFKLIYGQFKDKIERGEIAVAPFPLEFAITKRKLIEIELLHAQAVIFHVQQIEANEVFRSQKFAWLCDLLESKKLPVVFLNEDCPHQILQDFQNLFPYKEPIVIPNPDLGIDLAFYTGERRNHLATCICGPIEKEVIAPMISKAGLHKSSIQQIVEDFDLKDQKTHLATVAKDNRLNFIILEGSTKCGIELPVKKILDHLSWKEGKFFKIKFDSREGAIDSREKFYSKLHAKLTGRPEVLVNPAKVAIRLETILEEHPICLILDNPFAVCDHELVIEYWKTLAEPLIEIESKRLFFIVMNKSHGKKGWPTDHPDLDDLGITPVIFPPLSRIEQEHFNYWWGEKAARIREKAKVEDLHEKVSEILHEPYLEPVLGQLCLQLGYPKLIDNILPKFE